MKIMKSIIFILISLIVLSVFNVQTQASSPFCASSANDQNYEWIVRVQIHDGVQHSGPTPYSDYTDAPIATLTAGTTYNVEVDVATDGTEYYEFVKIWFDMNQNDAIEDPEELVFNVDKNVQTLGTFSGTVTVPSTAFNGHIYVRIIMQFIMQFNATPALCGTYTYGETEDYLVNVIGGTPNPENKTLTVATAGSGSGYVTSSPSGINTDGGVNSFDFSENEVVTLTATPTAGSSFTNWTGDCSGTNTSVAVTMDVDKNCTASFQGTGITEPTVTTQAVSDISATSATGNGNITDLGAPNPTAHGVVYNTTGSPTLADYSTAEGAASATGPFTSNMTGLSPNTTYYVRAYATNTAGTAYGNQVSFTATTLSLATKVDLTGPSTATAGAVSTAFTLTSQDADGNASNVTADTKFDLSSNSSGTKVFYSNAAGTSVITEVTVSNGTSTATFYYKDTETGALTVRATRTSGMSLGFDTHQVTVSLATTTLATSTSVALSFKNFKVTVTQIEMNNGTSWVTIFLGTAELDLVNGGGTFPEISDVSLPSGTYNEIRVTFRNSLPATGTLSYSGNDYYTTAATFAGESNIASDPTTASGSQTVFTFKIDDWGALNADVIQTYPITPPITVGPTTDYQPTLRFTISNTLLFKGTAGTASTYYFALGAPIVSIVEP